MLELFNFRTKVDLTDFTLIIPSISVGNVPQLTTDLLISSLDLRKVATIWHPAILSSVGPDPFKSNNQEVCTACELYVNESLHLAVVQLRSSIDHKLAKKFFDDFKLALTNFKLKEIVILASAFDYEMHNVSSNKYFYISNQSVDDLMCSLKIRPKTPEFNGKYVVHGSGFAVKLYEILGDEMPCTILIKYVSEGDNRPDAMDNIRVLSKILNCLKDMDPDQIKFPSSWSGVFGGPPPVGMY